MLCQLDRVGTSIQEALSHLVGGSIKLKLVQRFRMTYVDSLTCNLDPERFAKHSTGPSTLGALDFRERKLVCVPAQCRLRSRTLTPESGLSACRNLSENSVTSNFHPSKLNRIEDCSKRILPRNPSFHGWNTSQNSGSLCTWAVRITSLDSELDVNPRKRVCLCAVFDSYPTVDSMIIN